jgi:hypothetical protein
MWALKRGSNFGAVVYTLAWIILGNYIFLTLFLTVILEAFEKRYKVRPAGAGRMWQASMSAGSMQGSRAAARDIDHAWGGSSCLAGMPDNQITSSNVTST